MNYKEGYDWGKQSLETAGVSEAELDARLLLEKICGTDRNTLLVHGDRLLSEEEKNRYKDWIQKLSLIHILFLRLFLWLDSVIFRTAIEISYNIWIRSAIAKLAGKQDKSTDIMRDCVFLPVRVL